jgi:polar amino acid transport system permease protein
VADSRLTPVHVRRTTMSPADDNGALSPIRRSAMPSPRLPTFVNRVPWWLAGIGALIAWLVAKAWSDAVYREILDVVSGGIGTTVFVALVSFAAATVLGLAVAVGLMSRFVAVRQAARLYCEVLRGVPMLVLLFYVAFVGAPALVQAANAALAWLRPRADAPAFEPRDFSLMWRAILALVLGYSAFIAEVFRAGLQAVSRGQTDAARSLGLTPRQVFRHVTFPQGLRTILPALGNDFVSMVKDSALVSVLGVADITQMAKVYASGNFTFFETYNVVALVYLVMTLALSLALRALERRLRAHERR